MIGNRLYFSTYTPCTGRFVKITDGSLSRVAGVRTIILSPQLVLKGLRYVPNLSCNMLSISWLTSTVGCLVKFTPTACLFQDQILGRRIGSARQISELYNFDYDSSLKSRCQVVATGSISPLSSTSYASLSFGSS